MLALKPSSEILRPAKLLTMLLLGVCLPGCFSRQVSPEYPANWSPPDKLMVGSCPSVAGVYRNLGESGPSGVECGSQSRYLFGHDHGEWSCSPELLRNLGIAEQADSVVIEQPSEDLLEIKFRDMDGKIVGKEVLRRGWSFSCDDGSLTFSKVAPLGGWAMTPIWVLSLTGGGSTHTRSFLRDHGGALVMTVRESNTAFSIFIFVSASGTSYVRWLPANGEQPQAPGR